MHVIYAVSVSGNVLNDNFQDRKNNVLPVFIRMYTHTPLRARTNTSTLSYTRTYTRISVCIFTSGVSKKRTFNGKRLVFLRTRIHTETCDRTRKRTHTGNVRFATCVNGECFARKLRTAQLRILTISGHVIAVSA